MDFGWSSSRCSSSSSRCNKNSSNVEQHHETDADDERHLASLSVNELRTKLRARGLRVFGVKEELVNRLLHPESETPAQIRNGIAHSCLTTDYILRIGLKWVNIDEERQNVCETTNITRFKSFFGVEPRTMKDAYESFVDLCDDDDTSLKDFMMLIEWLKKCKCL